MSSSDSALHPLLIQPFIKKQCVDLKKENPFRFFRSILNEWLSPLNGKFKRLSTES